MNNLNNIPKHWQIKKLGEVCEIFQGYGFPKELQGQSVGKFPFYKVGDISKNVKLGYRYLEVCDNFINDETLLKIRAKPYPVNTIVFAKIGEGLKLNRRAIIKTSGIVDNNAIGLKARESICDNLFLYYFLTTVKLEDYAKATTVPSVRKSEIEDIYFVLPPLPEQHLIVSRIEELFSELENGKKQLQTALQQLKVYRQSLLKWAFEGKLTNKNVKDGELPEGWKWVKNKDILKYVTSGSRDWKQFYSTRGSRFVRTQDINSNKLDIDNAAYVALPEKVEGKRSLIEEGDILMTITGANVGKIAVVDFKINDAYVSQSVALLKYKDKRITKYLWYYFQAQGFGKSFIDKLVYGVGRPVLSLENMREVAVLICSIGDQKEIIDELESKLTICDKIEQTINESLLQAETLRQSILKMAFEGRLV